MGVTNYVAFDGEIISEINSTDQLDYMRDALGSVTGTVDAASIIQNQYRYKPFGAIQSQSC